MTSALQRTAIAAIGGGAALLGLTLFPNGLSSDWARIFSSPSDSRAQAATIPDTRAAEVLEPHCDCAPLWECMQKKSGSCSLLELQLRECVARNKRL